MKTKTKDSKLDYSLNYLNWLYIDKASFHTWVTNHPTKTMFRFTLVMNQISLTGWAPDKKDNAIEYDKTDILTLQISPETAQLSNDATYLGNIKLTKLYNSKIDKLLQKTVNAAYALFKPVNYVADSRHVAYEIYISSSISSSDIIHIHGEPDVTGPPAHADLRHLQTENKLSKYYAMKTITLNQRNYLILLLIVSCFYSCKTFNIATKGNKTVANLSGLYIDATTFHHWALKNDKILFQFTFNNKKITLQGYSMTDTTSFDTSETLNLIAANKKFKVKSTSLYLGNLRFSTADIAYVDAAATSNHLQYILFKPVDSDSFPGHVAYNVYVSNNTSFFAYNKKPSSNNTSKDFILVAYITNSYKPNSGTSRHLDPSPPAHL